jgi:hypothetical protein
VASILRANFSACLPLLTTSTGPSIESAKSPARLSLRVRCRKPSRGEARLQMHRVQSSVQKCQTTPAPTKRLRWRLLPVVTFSCGFPDQKSLASPRRLNLLKILTSRPRPA